MAEGVLYGTVRFCMNGGDNVASSPAVTLRLRGHPAPLSRGAKPASKLFCGRPGRGAHQLMGSKDRRQAEEESRLALGRLPQEQTLSSSVRLAHCSLPPSINRSLRTATVLYCTVRCQKSTNSPPEYPRLLRSHPSKESDSRRRGVVTNLQILPRFLQLSRSAYPRWSGVAPFPTLLASQP